MQRKMYTFSAEGPWRFPTQQISLGGQRIDRTKHSLSSRELFARLDLSTGMNILAVGELPHATQLRQRLGQQGQLTTTTLQGGPEETTSPQSLDRIVVLDLQRAFAQGARFFETLRRTLKPNGRIVLIAPRGRRPFQRSPWIQLARHHGFAPCLRQGAPWSDTLLLRPA